VPKSTTIIAFDHHAATTAAAVLLPGHRTPMLHALTSDTPTILRFVERVARGHAVQCCYEAGPCGFELQRALVAYRLPCDVIAPALIPRRAGDRVKTDRRDAGHLAVLYRAGALTAMHIPTEQEEAARDLLRLPRRHSRRSPARATPALQISPSARAALHRHHPFLGRSLQLRQRGAPPTVIDRAWHAQHRLHRRYRRLLARGKPKQHVVTAVARELSGFLWAALTR
jgi:hypothetical protein